MDTGAPAAGSLAPLGWRRWLLGIAVLGAAVPLLLTLLLNVAVAGSKLGSGSGLSVPSALAVSAAVTLPLIILFAVLYRRLRASRDRRFLVKLGAILWGVGGGAASSVFGAEPGAVLVSFPLIALVGAAASYLFILIADGRAVPA
ncbi:MAG: hypothetical protein RLO51_14540 [Thalassobaculum sp.]|uniref:hypothetical protein n=1 Tax=Thalassobaculum sp. TaxID=2022740 RepID=UPI0032EAC6BE